MKRRNTGPTAAIIDILKARSGGLCEVCGRSQAEQTHHRRPRRMGGSRHPDTNRPSNLLRVCMFCHQWIETNRLQATKYGLLLGDREKPRCVPMALAVGWRWLDDAGGFEEPKHGSEESCNCDDTHTAGCAVWTSNDHCDCAEEATS